MIPKIAAETQRPSGPYRPRPSGAGPERCVRSMVYHANGTPPNPFPGRALLVFDDSSWHEELTKDWIRKTAYQLSSEQMPVDIPGLFPWLAGAPRYECEQCGRTVDPRDCHGHIDGILTDLLKIDRLLEHKALNHFSFERIWKGEWPLDNISQSCIYTKGVRVWNPEISECLLLVKNKNTAQYVELLLQYDEAADAVTIAEMLHSNGERSTPGVVLERVVGDAAEKFRQVDAHAAAGTLPARPFELGTQFPCGYCRWAQTCWSNYAAEYEALSEDPALDAEWETRAAYYLEVSGHESRDKKEKDDLRDGIVRDLAAAGLKGGKAGPYVLRLSLQDHWSLDQDEIPPETLARARKNKPSLTLRITRPKAKEEKK